MAAAFVGVPMLLGYRTSKGKAGIAAHPASGPSLPKQADCGNGSVRCRPFLAVAIFPSLGSEPTRFLGWLNSPRKAG